MAEEVVTEAVVEIQVTPMGMVRHQARISLLAEEVVEALLFHHQEVAEVRQAVAFLREEVVGVLHQVAAHPHATEKDAQVVVAHLEVSPCLQHPLQSVQSRAQHLPFQVEAVAHQSTAPDRVAQHRLHL